MQSKIHQDIYVGTLMILVSIFLYSKTLSLLSGAALFPRILLAIFILFSILIIIGGFKKTKLMKQGEEVEYEGDENPLNFGNLKSPITTLFIVICYVSLLSLIGFFPSTILFMVVFLSYMKVKQWKTYVFTIIGLNVFIYLVFVLQLNVQLPVGLLFK